jgi:hypothetical protein
MSRHLSWWPENYNEVPTHSQMIEEMPMPLSDDQLYDRTVKCLEEFWYIGYQDRWVEVVKKIYDEFGLPLPPDTEQAGLTNYRDSMSDKMIADLTKFNQIDIRIYNEYRN